MHECPTKYRDQDLKEKNVHPAIMDSDEEGSENCLCELCFMAKKNKKLKQQLEAITKEQDVPEENLGSKEIEFTQSKSRDEELQQQIVIKKYTSTECLEGLTSSPTCIYIKRALYESWG